MQITFAHLCDYASVSREGKLSVMGIFSQITALQAPVIHPQAYLAFELEMNYAEIGRPFTIEVQIVDEDGKAIFNSKFTGSLQTGGAPPKPSDKPKVGQIFVFNGLKFDRFGPHDVNIFVNSQLDKQLQLLISKGAAPAAMP